MYPSMPSNSMPMRQLPGTGMSLQPSSMSYPNMGANPFGGSMQSVQPAAFYGQGGGYQSGSSSMVPGPPMSGSLFPRQMTSGGQEMRPGAAVPSALPATRAVAKYGTREDHPQAQESAHLHPETLQHYHDDKADVIQEIQHWDSEIGNLLPRVQELRDARYTSNMALLERVKELEAKLLS